MSPELNTYTSLAFAQQDCFFTDPHIILHAGFRISIFLADNGRGVKRGSSSRHILDVTANFFAWRENLVEK